MTTPPTNESENRMSTTEMDLTEASRTSVRVTAQPIALGAWLAGQNSDTQAAFLWGFASELYGLGSPNWEKQCAFIRAGLAHGGRQVLDDVFGELMEPDSDFPAAVNDDPMASGSSPIAADGGGEPVAYCARCGHGVAAGDPITHDCRPAGEAS